MPQKVKKRMKSSPGLPAIIDWIVRRCDGTYRRGNWAGKGPLPSIKGVTARVAHRRHPGQHTIAEIVLHMAYWKDAVTARLTGQQWRYDESQNWRAAVATEEGWAQARAELGAAHRRLMAALRTLTPGRLLEPVRGPWRLIDLSADIATHDTYHAAQIFVLRRLEATHKTSRETERHRRIGLPTTSVRRPTDELPRLHPPLWISRAGPDPEGKSARRSKRSHARP